jgi:cyclophilin family peptidyl-prolyl cis-trans isomerase
MNNKTLAYVILAVVVICSGVFALVRLRGDNSQQLGGMTKEQSNPPSTETKPVETPPVAKAEPKKEIINGCEKMFDQTKMQEQVNLVNNKVEVNVKGYGKFTVVLDTKQAPKTSENFLKLVNAGFYDCLTFHRLAKGFVVQGGDPAGNGTGGPGYTVPAEIGLKHKKGSIAMARLGDQVNPNKESSGSQFYIALQDLPQLDGEYTVFGNVVSGLEVIEKIASAKVVGNAPDGPPVTPIVMEKLIIIK